MTDNIQKLYEIAGIKEKRGVELTVDATSEEFKFNEHHVYYGYPTFTAEKQLELIKCLCKNTYRNYFKILFDFQNKTWYMECDCYQTPNKRNFEESLAILTISIWQDLTEEQKQEIKRILE